MLRHHRQRRAALAACVTALVVPLSVAVVAPSPAQADDAGTFTVVGTSDVFDSGLSDNVLKPGFEAYERSLGKDVTYNYVSKGTDAAITYAEAGTASALVVHAASLENQFVGQGYSLEQYGRAFTWGDFVLLGPDADPAGVRNGTEPSHDIVDAYEKIAAAGAAGNANFVSRGQAPGTTVQEHAIWALTSGVALCDVPTASGGGRSPVNDTPSGTCGAKTSSPSWYQVTNQSQAANVTTGDACNFDSPQRNDCYVFTDKGTFQYLRSQPGAISNLRIVAQGNTAPGQESLLINSFHAYGVNPAKFAGNPNVAINTDAAHDFLTWVTSPAGQAAIGAYLSTDPDHAPFRPSAAPVLTTSSVPGPGGTTTVAPQTRLTFTGQLRNATPGTPALSGETVKLQAVPTGSGAAPATIATANTDASGVYTISYAPRRNLTYTLATDEIAKVENEQLSPPFGDLLQATSVPAGTVNVRGVVKPRTAEAGGRSGVVKLTGAVAPIAERGAQVQLLAAHPGNALKVRATRAIAAGTNKYDLTYALGKGTWTYQLRYQNAGVIVAGLSPRKTIKLK